MSRVDPRRRPRLRLVEDDAEALAGRVLLAVVEWLMVALLVVALLWLLS